MKYVFITGGVLSGLGKGITTCSIGKMLQVRGYKVNVVKIDPYINVDAGTMNPYVHGEVYVLDDGYEADMDLGQYERFLDLRLSRWNNITSGQIYLSVIQKERRGDYLGKCVQLIPHVTDEIKHRIRVVAERKVDVLLCECGGTVGDLEAGVFLEAFRQMRLEVGPDNSLLVHVTLVPVLDAVGEQKTKPTQTSVRELQRIGLSPDIIVARCEEGMLEAEPKRKIALYGNVSENAVFTSPNVKSVYEAPIVLDRQGMGGLICDRLHLPKRKPNWREWREIVNSFLKPRDSVSIAMCGKYAQLADSYVSINDALAHAGAYVGARVIIDWIETEDFEKHPERLGRLSEYDGVLVPGGFGERGTEGKIRCIEYARKHGLPFLGICFGFQLAVVEYARNVLGIGDANSIEVDPDTPHPVIDLLPEQKRIEDKGGTMRLGTHEVMVDPGTLSYKLYRKEKIYERHRHRYEVNPTYIKRLVEGGLAFSAKSPDAIRMEALEVPYHYFFYATQFHPEFMSRPGKPDPAYYGFIKACLDRKRGREKPEFYA
ncbi:MAG: CTP synthase [Candidatus Bathyarchaeia archaeon]